MTAPAFERLQRILALEEKQGWRNRGVIGGIQAMSKRWASDARQEQADAKTIDVVVNLMVTYAEATQEKRPEIAGWMRGVLAGGEIPDVLKRSAEKGRVKVKVVGKAEPSNRPPTRSQPKPKAQAQAHAQSKSKSKQPPRPQPQHYTQEYEEIPPAEPTHVAQERIRQLRESEARATLALHDPVDSLPGVGKVFSEKLANLKIHRILDLLWHLPARHEDFSQLRTISQMQPGEQVTVVANLWEVRKRKVSMKREMLQGILADGTGTLHATWWNKYLEKQLNPGSTMRFSGKVGLYMGQKTLENPVFEDVDSEMVATGRLSPVYRLTEGVTNKRMRVLIKQVVDDCIQHIKDPLPLEIRQRYQLASLPASLRHIHYPESQDALDRARRRLAFDEFFYIQLGVQRRRQSLKAAESQSLASDEPLITQFKSTLPFQLTQAQSRVLDEIAKDIARTVPMTRLVQGDVGSGKTAVAAGAMHIATANGAQSALLAPTQILAEQHYRGLSSLLSELTRPDGSPLTVALLTGRVTGKERTQVLEQLEIGEIDILVGTTAIIQEQVSFKNLSFVVVDEQHRFGVEQRGALRNKGDYQPHLLVMSATPIPRSLALTVYGDLDVSVIDERPPGRIPIKTKWFRPRERERLYRFVRREASEGRQAFIVYPLVEESEKLNVGAAVDEHARLGKEVFPDLRLALLHGQMKGSEKDAVMSAFAAGDYDVLVSTSVIEVGIDVPNASLILIEDAERFGLAQLHQFRGRVGRGQHESYCALVSKAQGADAEERLRVLEETDDGFVLAEKDMELRGPGDFLGTRQSGLPELQMAQMADLETLGVARKAAEELLAEEPELQKYPQLAERVAHFWRGHGDVS